MKIMNSSAARKLCICLASCTAIAALAQSAAAAVVITEVDPAGSSATYGADWFELTNTGSTSVSLANWTMMDAHAYSPNNTVAMDNVVPAASGYSLSNVLISNSNKSPAAALTLVNGSTLAPGQSAVFLESPSSASASGALISSFETAWFGSNVPANLVMGTYNDTSSTNFGLSSSGDMVNIFSTASASTATLIASVAFGADGGSPESTFDNSAGLNDVLLNTKSATGVNGAFVSANGAELGSPGFAPVPLPATAWLLITGIGGLGLLARRRRIDAAG
jgi:Lamin Tail Domain